ncbi:MAG: glutathione-disulfide reductase [Alphaproteobacteria bacterium]|nr:glutathione-disulfide reductase [Alphaproteobacteria bacterium]
MASYDLDLFVIGAGSGGTRAARIAASHGARVAVAEERYLGGTCVNVGCVPKKLFVYAAHFAEDFEDAAGFGWQVGDRRHDWPRLIAAKNAEIERLNGVYRRLLVGAGATVIEGRAHLEDAHTVVVGDERYTAERILVATGGWPTVPEFPGNDLVITSNEAFFLEELPKRIVVAGGGYVSVEFAGIFNALGVEVIQLYRGPLFLRGFDDDLREALAEEMIKKGVDIRFNVVIDCMERNADGSFVVDLSDRSTIETDLVMFATGRHPNSRGFGLEALGVALDDNGFIEVDADWRTSVPHIYAIGDCTNTIKLTPVAIKEGHILADTLFGPADRRMDYDAVPSAVFSQPSIGTVGLTEAQARERYPEIDIYKSSFRPMKHTLSGRDERTLMKLVVDRKTDRVVGAHMLGPEAGEIIQGIAVAIKAGASKADFDATVGIHPTSAEEFVTMRSAEPEPAQEAAE